jgi:hypothetical protein
MIVFTDAFVLSAQAAGESLRNPRIGWQTFTRDAGVVVTASSETDEGPKEMVLEPDTATYWQPFAMPAWIQFDFGSAKEIDYAGLAEHTIGSSGAAVEARWSEDVENFFSYLFCPNAASNGASTPDAALHDISTDLELVAQVAASDYTPAADMTVASKWTESGNQRTALLRITTGGLLSLLWSDNGTNVLSKNSTVALSTTDGDIVAVKATLEVDNGAAGHDVKFWTSTDFDPVTGVGTWAQLGATVTTGSTTSVFNGTGQFRVSGQNLGAAQPFDGKVFYADMKNGIGGAVVARFRPEDALDNEATSWQGEFGETWTVNQSGSPAATLVLKRLAYGVAPGSDAPLMFIDVPRNAKYIRVPITGPVAPKIGVIYAGKSLPMLRPPLVGYEPITMAREVELHNSMSQGGQFLGQGVRRRGVASEISFQGIDQTWYRGTFDAFVVSAQQFPYFLAWSPQAFPLEVAYAWTRHAIRPRYTESERFGVTWIVEGIGSE